MHSPAVAPSPVLMLGPVVADVPRHLRLYTDLGIRAKGTLLIANEI
jgi:hypothetical protein